MKFHPLRHHVFLELFLVFDCSVCVASVPSVDCFCLHAVCCLCCCLFLTCRPFCLFIVLSFFASAFLSRVLTVCYLPSFLYVEDSFYLLRVCVCSAVVCALCAFFLFCNVFCSVVVDVVVGVSSVCLFMCVRSVVVFVCGWKLLLRSLISSF